MKTKIIVLMAIALSIMACKDEKKDTTSLAVNEVQRTDYKIIGELTNYPDGKIYYQEMDENGKKDSTNVVNGKFEFIGSLVEPTQVMLNSPDRKSVRFYLDNDNYTIKGDLDKATITGGKINDEYNKLKVLLEPSEAKLKKMQEDATALTKDGKPFDQEERQEKAMEIMNEQNDVKLAYIKNNPNSFVGLSEMSLLTHMMPPTPVKAAYDGLSDELKSTVTGKKLGERLDILMKSAVGVQAMDFTQNSVEGKPITFSEFNKGKYVLIDFWASWCGPCRAENPNVLKAYKKYHPIGFDVISVSIDDKEDKWKQAIKEDGMPWMQVSDLKGRKNDVAVMYGIQAVPTTLLVNPEGKIIARNLRGKALHEKLAEIMK